MGTAVARPRTGHKSKPQKLAEATLLLHRLNAGEQPATICYDLGISRSTFDRRIAWARDNVHDPAVETYRLEAAARLATGRQIIARALQQTHRVLIDPETGQEVEVPEVKPGEVAALVSQWVRIEETEAKLRGAYAPVTVEHRVIVEDAFARLMSELNARPATQPQETRP